MNGKLVEINSYCNSDDSDFACAEGSTPGYCYFSISKTLILVLYCLLNIKKFQKCLRKNIINFKVIAKFLYPIIFLKNFPLFT